MSKVLVAGGGLAGVAAANELAAYGRRAVIIEKTGALGGKVRGYGCKATKLCSNCGVCLTKSLWDSVENNDLIEIRTDTELLDLSGSKGRYTVAVRKKGEVEYIDDISDVIVATGFKGHDIGEYDGFVEISGAAGGGGGGKGSVIFGSDIEKVFKYRGEKGPFETEPKSVAFIQCYGSRDKKESAMYCSRVCCAYSSRAAKVIKEFYPDCAVTFFYMEMQQVKKSGYFDELKEFGISFIKCRPVKVEAGDPAVVYYDGPETGKREEMQFDLVVLSDGIRPQDDAGRVAEICGLGQDENGFLDYVKGIGDADETGIYIAGCAGGPAKIDEVYSQSGAIARRICR